MATNKADARPTQSRVTNGNSIEAGERTALKATHISIVRIGELYLGSWDDAMDWQDGETLNLRDGDGYHHMTFYVSMLTKHPPGWSHEHHIDRKRLQLAVDIIEWRMSLGKKLLIHCYFGRDRSPLVVAHYLVRAGWIDTLDSAYIYLKDLRPLVIDRREWVGATA
jgi:hypothetical protein